jgi:hypothetical protein
METHIAILEGNVVHNLLHSSRRGSIWKDYNAVAINNFSNFGVDRTVTYYRPEAERIAISLNKTFSPGPELEPPDRLAGRVEVKVVLGHDLGSNNRPEPRRFWGRIFQGMNQPGSAPCNGFRLRPANIWPGVCYKNLDKIV